LFFVPPPQPQLVARQAAAPRTCEGKGGDDGDSKSTCSGDTVVVNNDDSSSSSTGDSDTYDVSRHSFLPFFATGPRFLRHNPFIDANSVGSASSATTVDLWFGGGGGGSDGPEAGEVARSRPLPSCLCELGARHPWCIADHTAAQAPSPRPALHNVRAVNLW
jgi:hypothetical protein